MIMIQQSTPNVNSDTEKRMEFLEKRVAALEAVIRYARARGGVRGRTLHAAAGAQLAEARLLLQCRSLFSDLYSTVPTTNKENE